jgi:hypothetical protein
LHWITARIIRQWLTWNARLGEQLTIAWLELPKYLLDTVTPLVTLAFVAVLARFSQRSLKDANPVLALVSGYALLMLLWPRLEIFFWRTTATGYLQPLLLCLLLALLLTSPGWRAFEPPSFGFALALPIGVLAGACFENVGPALLLLLLLECRRRRLPPWRPGPLLLCVAVLGGWLSLILSPSTTLRTAALGGHSGTPPLQILSALLTTSGPLLLAFALSLVLLWRQGAEARAGLACLGPLGWAALFSLLPLLRAPYIQQRAFCFVWVVLLIVVLRALLATLPAPWLQLLALAALSFSVAVAGVYNSYNLKASARDAWIRSQRDTSACETGIAVAPIENEAMSRLLNLREDWYFYKPGGVSPEVEAYYGCKLLRGTP